MAEPGVDYFAPNWNPDALRYKCPRCGAMPRSTCQEDGQACIHIERLDKHAQRQKEKNDG